MVCIYSIHFLLLPWLKLTNADVLLLILCLGLGDLDLGGMDFSVSIQLIGFLVS